MTQTQRDLQKSPGCTMADKYSKQALLKLPLLLLLLGALKNEALVTRFRCFFDQVHRVTSPTSSFFATERVLKLSV